MNAHSLLSFAMRVVARAQGAQPQPPVRLVSYTCTPGKVRALMVCASDPLMRVSLTLHRPDPFGTKADALIVSTRDREGIRLLVSLCAEDPASELVKGVETYVIQDLDDGESMSNALGEWAAQLGHNRLKKGTN